MNNNVTNLIFFCVTVIVAGLLIFISTCLSKKGVKNLDTEYYRTQCLKVEHQLKRDEPSSYHLAVINADKLVEHAMRDKGLAGQTMGERLKNSPKLFSDLNGLWTSHKLRNRIAHEPDVTVSYEEAKIALMQFRKALKDLGAI